jgi:hypothetical protein
MESLSQQSRWRNQFVHVVNPFPNLVHLGLRGSVTSASRKQNFTTARVIGIAKLKLKVLANLKRRETGGQAFYLPI